MTIDETIKLINDEVKLCSTEIRTSSRYEILLSILDKLLAHHITLEKIRHSSSATPPK